MTNINNINGLGVGLNTNLPQKNTAPAQEEQTQEVQQQSQPNLKFVSGDDVMNIMAQQATMNQPIINKPNAYDVGKYVTQEQAQRIAGFVTSFDDIVAQNLQSITEEFGNSISDDMKMNIALSSTDKLI